MKTDNTDRALQALKEQMTEEQRNDMAELLKNELIRREKEKMNKSLPKHKSGVRSSAMSTGLDADGVGDLYNDLDKNVRELRLRKLERQLEEAKAQQKRLGKLGKSRGAAKLFNRATPKISLQDAAQAASAVAVAQPSFKNILILTAIVALAGLKVVFSSGEVNAAIRPAAPAMDQQSIEKAGGAEPAAASELPIQGAAPEALPPAKADPALDRRVVGWSENEKRLLSELDARRVELEKRKAVLDDREADIEKQSRVLAERLAELRTLTTRLAELRKEKDHKYEARLEQLANVYSSMAPNEAAPLIGKLDEEIALALLERMPEKRMGQILGMMGAERAVELTRVLSDKGKLR